MSCCKGSRGAGWGLSIGGMTNHIWSRMTAIEQALERVRRLTEEEVRELLRWLGEVQRSGRPPMKPTGAVAMLGCARRFYPEPRTTAQWLRELREGEE